VTTAAPASATKPSDGVGLSQETVNGAMDHATPAASNDLSATQMIEQSQAPLVEDSMAVVHIEHTRNSVPPSDGPTDIDGNGPGGNSSPAQVHATTTLRCELAANGTNSSPSTNAGGSEDHATDTPKASLQSSGCEAQVGDVDMQDATSSTSPSSGHGVDENIPSWLTPMIGYLRSLLEDVAWQTLVTEFIDFEKRGPPHGVSSILLYH